MTTNPYRMFSIESPHGRTSEGRSVRLSDPVLDYLLGIEDTSQRVSDVVTSLSGDTNAANMSAKIDELIAALKAADLMKDS